MKNFLDKFFSRSKNLDYISQNLKQITLTTPANKIFEAINNFSEKSEIRYVGGCVRKVIKKENVDDIDLATNLTPLEVCEALKNKQISYYETGIEHGTITAIIDEYKYEITSLRKDVSTDGRHAEVEFSLDWKEDASRRDFTINSIYADGDGNLFDPFNGKKDLEEGYINFIGNAEKRIQEDYLRILRYLRFYLNYSNHKHQPEFLIALLVIDGTDNADYFLYKFKISNKDKKRLKLIDLFYREKVTLNNFTEKNLNKFFYFNGRQAVLDIINFKIFISNKVEKKLIKLLDTYKEKVIPTLPIGADLLMSKFQIPEGKTLGNKLKRIEETWVQNGFQISDKQVQQIVKS